MSESFPHRVDIADALTGRRTSPALQNLAAEANELALADTLSRLANHGAQAAQHEDDLHDRCVECEMLKLLARCVGFGRQILDAEREPVRTADIGSVR